jgi:hypothetical protein
MEPHFPYAHRNLLPSGLGLVLVPSILYVVLPLTLITTLLD